MGNSFRSNRQVVLVIFDGWGHREEGKGNAIAAANTPCFDELWRSSPHALLEASGVHVGLPQGKMGNSEIGHMTIGAGRVIDTDVVRINKAFDSGEAKNNPAFKELFAHIRKHGSTLHVMGLVSPGGVHSHMEHLFAFMKLAKEAGILKIAVHVFTDGRDTPPQSAHDYVDKLENILRELGAGRIASLSGRYYAMDRDKNWDRVSKVEDALFEGKGEVRSGGPLQALAEVYKSDTWDEYIPPMIFPEANGQPSVIGKNDGVFFFNFRADRARMITRKIEDRLEALNLCFVTMTQYQKGSKATIAFPPAAIEDTLAACVAASGRSQAHIAETEKYAHVTYFLNGGVEAPHSGEDFVLVESRKDVETHDEAPEMRAKEITDEAIAQLERGTDLVVLNYANPDMVGHVANFGATIRAVEAVDSNLGRLVAKARKRNAALLITADHGNAEMIEDPETDAPHTAHTINPVPVIVDGMSGTLRNGTLADVAPTVLELLGLPAPSSMTGKSLLKNVE